MPSSQKIRLEKMTDTIPKKITKLGTLNFIKSQKEHTTETQTIIINKKRLKKVKNSPKIAQIFQFLIKFLVKPVNKPICDRARFWTGRQIIDIKPTGF